MSASASIATQKKILREAAIRERGLLPSSARDHYDAQIAGRLQALISKLAPRTLGFCWPFRQEPDLRAMIEAWLEADPGRVAALPVVQQKGTAMIFRQWTAQCKMVLDRHGIPQPESTPAVTPELLLLPLNAFDERGFRIGYGGGFFDRTLAGLDPRPVAIGFGYECGRVDSALPEPHDIAMDWIVTEAATRDTRSHAR